MLTIEKPNPTAPRRLSDSARPSQQPPKLLDQMREVIRVKHYSLSTEKNYIQWARRFILFHGKRHPRDMGAPEVESFLSALAVERTVSASTQNQAMHAILFLYRDVLGISLPWLPDFPRAIRLPIGNLSSQFFANVYLDALDQFVKHGLRCRHYIRYVDDFVLLHESPQWLNEAKDRIEAFLAEKLAARLNPKKTILQPVSRGIDFVGQVIKPWHRTLRRRTFNEAIKRVRSLEQDEVFESANSYFGLLRQTTSSHNDRAMLANVARRRGHAVKADLTKIYRRKTV